MSNDDKLYFRAAWATTVAMWLLTETLIVVVNTALGKQHFLTVTTLLVPLLILSFVGMCVGYVVVTIKQSLRN